MDSFHESNLETQYFIREIMGMKSITHVFWWKDEMNTDLQNIIKSHETIITYYI